MFLGRQVKDTLARRCVQRGRPFLLFALLTLFGVVAAPAFALAQSLTLTWVDNAGGQASFIIQRAPSTTGPYTQIAQAPLGIVSYTDSTVSPGSTYCYQVAAVNSAGVSAFSTPACGTPSGGFTLAVTKAGTGGGTVTSSPAGINCGTTCSSTYPVGKVVNLTAAPSSGSTFSGWSGGGCSGPDPACTLVGNVPVTVTATLTVSGPSLTVSATSVPPGGAVTATLTNSPGGSTDWLALAQVGAPDTSYLTWVYVGVGVTNRQWMVTIPTTPGQYEFRFFRNDGYVRAATSPRVTVSGPSLTVSATSVPPGGAVTATLTNSPGGSTDWLALAQVGAPDTSYLTWVYVGVGVTNRQWMVTIPTTPGQYEFRFFRNDGYVRAATSPSITVKRRR